MSFLAAILNRAPLYIIATIQTANTILRPRPRRCRRHVLDTEGYEKGEEKKKERKGKKTVRLYRVATITMNYEFSFSVSISSLCLHRLIGKRF